MEHTKGSLILSRMLALSTDTQVTAPCGCELFRSGSDGKSVTFRYCDTHAAAPVLLKALERAMDDAWYNDDSNIERLEPEWIAQARAAIKAAKEDA